MKSHSSVSGLFFMLWIAKRKLLLGDLSLLDIWFQYRPQKACIDQAIIVVVISKTVFPHTLVIKGPTSFTYSIVLYYF